MRPAVPIPQGAVGMGGPAEVLPVEASNLGLCSFVTSQYQRSDITQRERVLSLGRDTAPSS